MRWLSITVVFLASVVMAHGEPMTFRSVSDGGNFTNCCWTVASGQISAQTPAQFSAFVEAEKAQGSEVSEIRMDGYGEDVEAGIELGRLIRKLGANTTLGVSRQYNVNPPWFERAPGGACEGACAYAFLGGASRNVPTGDTGGGRLGFSQFHDSGALLDVEAKSVSGSERELARVQGQILTGKIVQYLKDMNVAASLYPMAASVRPGDPVRYLTRDELIDLRIETGADTAGPWAAYALSNKLMASVRARNSKRSINLYCLSRDRASIAISVEDGNLEDIKSIAGDRGKRHAFLADGIRVDATIWDVRGSAEGVVYVILETSRAGAAAIGRAKALEPVDPGLSRAFLIGYWQLFAFPEITGDERLPIRVLEMCK